MASRIPPAEKLVARAMWQLGAETNVQMAEIMGWQHQGPGNVGRWLSGDSAPSYRHTMELLDKCGWLTLEPSDFTLAERLLTELERDPTVLQNPDFRDQLERSASAVEELAGSLHQALLAQENLTVARLAATSISLASRSASSCSPTSALLSWGWAGHIPAGAEDYNRLNPATRDNTERNPRMLRIALVAVVLAALASTSLAGAATKDPRKCTLAGQPQTAAACAQRAAAAVTRAKIAATRTHPAAPTVICKSLTAKLLSWRCQANDDQGHGWTSTVRFAATSAGWRTYVTLKGPIIQ